VTLQPPTPSGREPAADSVIVFVYNADGGLLNAARDIWHRLRSPQTYPCDLCRLTYGVRGMNQRWRAFLDSLDRPVVFVHRDEFRAQHSASSWRNVDLPVALLQTDRHLQMLVSAERIRSARTLKRLMAEVSEALATVSAA
jgi:hypothetical protein